MSEGTKQTGGTAGAAGDILLADDEPVVRKTYRALFEGEGYSVRTARNGEEAVAMFAERRPDLVLLDVMMPRMSGTAACAAIRGFMAEAGLSFGRFDFIRKDGVLHFLEVNPNGQWAWLDEKNEHGLVTLVADAIKAEDQAHRARPSLQGLPAASRAI